MQIGAIAEDQLSRPHRLFGIDLIRRLTGQSPFFGLVFELVKTLALDRIQRIR
jgi:hypothetical protein